MKKGSIVYGAFKFKCPRCQEGDLFNKPMKLSNPMDMPTNCSECGQKFEPEPGYYYGAMFLSYIILGWFCLGIVGFCIMVLGCSVEVSFAILIAIIAIIFFWNLRFTRALWINLMIKYDGNILKEERQRV
ncbi:MAG: DUF983 domain-containing protein [Saprospiraceae bacterium]|nr:DUF983 domain-containing protein [Saprospiraceae bacterium]